MVDRVQVKSFKVYNFYLHTKRATENICLSDSTSSSSINHRRIINNDQEYRGDLDNEDEDEDDWKPKKRKRRNAPNSTNNGNKCKKRKKKDDLIVLSQPSTELDFHSCIIPLDKLR